MDTINILDIVEKLYKTLDDCCVLNLEFNSNRTIINFNGLEKLKNLAHFYIRDSNFDFGKIDFSKLNKLKDISFDNCNGFSLLDFSKNNLLEHLRVLNCDKVETISIEGNAIRLIHLAKSKNINKFNIKTLPSQLEYLYLIDTKIQYKSESTYLNTLNSVYIYNNLNKDSDKRGYAAAIDSGLFDFKVNENLNESWNQSEYLSWKRKNVTIRGMKEIGQENNAGAMLGRGLYSAFLANKSLAKEYGDVRFVLNAIPKKPKVFNSLNDWEIWFYNTLVNNYSKAAGHDFPDKRDFDKKTTIEDEMQKLGFDGIIIKGREMVNYKPENIMYFKTERELQNYYENMMYFENKK